MIAPIKMEVIKKELEDLYSRVQLLQRGAFAGTNPLVRTKWIDGDTTTPAASANGSVGNPFASVSAALTAIGVPTSASDANQTMTLLISPATVAAYTESPAFPAFRNLKLWSTGGVMGQIGLLITGSPTWANAAGGGAVAGTTASLSLHDVSISGSVTITDDGSVPGFFLLSGSDEGRFNSPAPGVVGSIVATGATNLNRITIAGAAVGTNITSTASATGALVTVDNGSVLGSITCKSLTATRSVLNGTAFAFNPGSTSTIFQCTFANATAITAGAGSTLVFDGPSWQSFREAGGTIVSGVVLVVGGSQGAFVDGGNMGDASINVSLNGTGASPGFTTGGNFYHADTAFGASRTFKALTGGGEKTGDTIRLSRVNNAAQTLVVQNNAATTLATLPASQRGFAELIFNVGAIANDWNLSGVGSGA